MERVFIKKYKVAHSPDSDDLAMFAPIRFGWVEIGKGKISLSADQLDIETLNRNSLEGVYDITAISFGVYPFIVREYALLRTAVSFGYGYGPKLIKKRNKRLKRRFKVGLSGPFTTNGLIFKIAYPEARPIYLPFNKIEEAVISGKVDAGVVIHESILTLSEEVVVERELWDVWVELIGDELPLPLGGMAIRRSIPLLSAIEIEEGLKKGVEIANRFRQRLIETLQSVEKIKIEKELLNRYLEMYAGTKAVEMGEEELKALNFLYQLGMQQKLLPSIGEVRNYLIPRNYRKFRFDGLEN